jgi:hypothetical protein
MSIVCPDAQEPSGQRLYLYDTRQRAKKTLQQVSTAIVHSTNQPLARDGWHRRYRRHRPDGHAATLPAPAKHPKMWRTGQFYVAPIPAALVRSRISCREYLHRHEQLTSGLRTGVATAASTCLIHIPKAFPMSAPTRARCCGSSSCTHISQTPRVSPAQQAWHRPTHKQHAMPRKRQQEPARSPRGRRRPEPPRSWASWPGRPRHRFLPRKGRRAAPPAFHSAARAPTVSYRHSSSRDTAHAQHDEGRAHT